MRIRLHDGRTMTLSARQFVAAGGEAQVFARGGEAFKIYSDVQRVPSQEKLDALSAIQHPNVLVPHARVMDADTGVAVGVLLPYLADADPLCAYTTSSAWSAHGVTAAQRFSWVVSIRDQVTATHEAGALVVDLNLMNVLVHSTLDAVSIIDVDSFAMAGFPPTAQADSIRDRTVPRGTVSQGTDWFAFAVVAFQVMTGIHPFRGHHATLKSLEARMNAQVSVFDDAVHIPHVATPFLLIPDGWLAWFRQVFVSGYRGAPPADDDYVVVPRILSAPETNETVTVHTIGKYVAPILDACMLDGALIVRTEEGVYLGHRRICDSPSGRVAFGLAGPGVPVMGTLRDGAVWCTELATGVAHQLAFTATELMSSGTRIYARSGGTVLELQWFRGPKGWWVVPKAVTQAHALSARLHPGVVTQCLLGATYVSLLTQRGRAVQYRVPQLDGCEVLEARYQDGVLFVRVRQGEDSCCWVFRQGSGPALSGWTCEQGNLNFTVLRKRVVVSEGKMGALHLFDVASDSWDAREIPIHGVDGCGILFEVGQGLGMICGTQVLRLRMQAA